MKHPFPALLSIIFPGAGHFIKGETAAGVLWFFMTMIGYVCLFIPGVLLHLNCIDSAYNDNQKVGGV